jgi:predicted regulator of Ras-like GTPase activity (Roadblock/LC7/MglB family)
MANLAELVRSLLHRPGVEAVLLVSGDGLAIESAARGDLDCEAVAALAATLMRQAARLGEAAARGHGTVAVLEYDRGLVIQVRVGAGDWLVLLTEPEADVGELLYDLRQHQPALAALL